MASMMASTVGTRRTDTATLRGEGVGPDAALTPLLDYAFPRLLVIRQVPKLCPEGKGGARRCLTSSVCCSKARVHQFSSLATASSSSSPPAHRGFRPTLFVRHALEMGVNVPSQHQRICCTCLAVVLKLGMAYSIGNVRYCSGTRGPCRVGGTRGNGARE